jgi:LDH2 family malate/lactate/ureidoglycolate dehydrogenase
VSGPKTLGIKGLADVVRAMLTAAGVEAHEALVISNHVADAEARGSRSQGLVRVGPYAKWARQGKIVSPTRMTVERETGAALVVSAHNGWGHVAARWTMDLCMERAATTGLCLAVVQDTNHIGRLGYYVEAAAERGMIGLIACSGNPDSAWVAPWNGIRPLFGTNPFAIGFPRRNGPPVVVDLSTTQGARGNVLLAQKQGKELPEGWAFDTLGNPTRDPRLALPPHGTLAPLGGHKGYALAVAVEILCGVLSGIWPPASSANLVGAIRVEAFLPLETYHQSLDGLICEIKACAPRPGAEEVRLPGEGSHRRGLQAVDTGVEVSPELWGEVVALARELGVNHPLLG